jgi:hypothetical protein
MFRAIGPQDSARANWGAVASVCHGLTGTAASQHQAAGRGTYVSREQNGKSRPTQLNRHRDESDSELLHSVEDQKRRSTGADQPPGTRDEHPSLGRRATAHREWQLLGATGDKWQTILLQSCLWDFKFCLLVASDYHLVFSEKLSSPGSTRGTFSTFDRKDKALPLTLTFPSRMEQGRFSLACTVPTFFLWASIINLVNWLKYLPHYQIIYVAVWQRKNGCKRKEPATAKESGYTHVPR